MNYPSVSTEIYQAVSRAASPEFAFSYLLKASQDGNRIMPFTVIAFERIRDNRPAMAVLNDHHIQLCRPEPFSEHRLFPPWGRAMDHAA